MSRNTRASETATPTQRPPVTGRKRRARKDGDLPDNPQQQKQIGIAANQALAGNPLVSMRAADRAS